MITRPEVIFVGGFDDRFVKGGQIFACKALVASPISAQVRWVLIDSSMVSLPPPPFWRRAISAIGRIFSFARALSRSPSAALIFTSAGASFVEKSVMVLLARLCGTPVVLCPRSGLIIDMVERSWLARLMVKASTSVSLVVCQGQGWANYYSGLAPATRTRVIPNFIDTDAYATIPTSPLGVEAHVLFLGWMDRNKGIHELLAAAERLVSRGRRFRVILAGSGGELDAFRASVAASCASGFVEAIGWADAAEKRRLLGWCDILALPSYREGLPNVVLEAMASGRAVVATAVGAVPETVQDGVTGLLCQPGDVDSLVDALDRLITQPELTRAMGVAARVRALNAYSVAAQWPAWRSAIFSQLHEA